VVLTSEMSFLDKLRNEATIRLAINRLEFVCYVTPLPGTVGPLVSCSKGCRLHIMVPLTPTRPQLRGKSLRHHLWAACKRG
jgi:hypothetical protein